MKLVSPLQELFALFFSILYGIMLSSCMGLSLFSWGLWEHAEVKKRIIVSVALVNFFPILYFIPIYGRLIFYDNPKWSQVLGTFLMSMSIFLFYRIMLWYVSNYKHELYWDGEFKLAPQLCTRINGISPYQKAGIKFYLTLAILGIIFTFILIF